jgi:formylglycine-generating enzyme required for sulfatase activity
MAILALGPMSSSGNAAEPTAAKPQAGLRGNEPAEALGKEPKPLKDPRAPKSDNFVNSIGMKFVKIPAGEFTMGGRPVKITKAFLVGVFPVTGGEWTAVMSGRFNESSGGGPPANGMTWYEAVEFCKKLSEKEGRKYRLPTEAEWEYFCRAGTTTTYFWGDDADQCKDYAWFGENGGNPNSNPADKKPNPWGLYGLLGPGLQWCSDWYGPYAGGPQSDPQGPDEEHAQKTPPFPSAYGIGPARIIRGVPYDVGRQACRSAGRACNPPDRRSSAVGFRVVMELPPELPSGGRETKSSITDGLTVEYLGGFLRRLDQSGPVKPVLEELKRIAENAKEPAKADEAKAIITHVEAWGKGELERAKALETQVPTDAEKAYQNLLVRFEGLEPAKTAQERLQDKKFQDDLRSWALVERMQAAEKRLKKDVPGTRRSAKDVEVARVNAVNLGQIKTAAQALAQQGASPWIIEEANAVLERCGMEKLDKPSAATAPSAPNADPRR